MRLVGAFVFRFDGSLLKLLLRLGLRDQRLHVLVLAGHAAHDVEVSERVRPTPFAVQLAADLVEPSQMLLPPRLVQLLLRIRVLRLDRKNFFQFLDRDGPVLARGGRVGLLKEHVDAGRDQLLLRVGHQLRHIFVIVIEFLHALQSGEGLAPAFGLKMRQPFRVECGQVLLPLCLLQQLCCFGVVRLHLQERLQFGDSGRPVFVCARRLCLLIELLRGWRSAPERQQFLLRRFEVAAKVYVLDGQQHEMQFFGIAIAP